LKRRVIACLVMSLAAFAAAGPATGAQQNSHVPAKTSSAKTPPTAPPAVGQTKNNPLLPPAIREDEFFIDLSLVQKQPNVTPEGFAPLYSAEDWAAFRERFGAEADGLPRLKVSGQLAFAEKLIAAGGENGSGKSKRNGGLQRLLLLRAAAIAYRNREGFPVADKAVAAYLVIMDKKSAAQVGGLWTIANQMARMAVTPKPERIRYDGIAARANMQLALLMLEADQVDAAQNITKQVAYHEGWLKGDGEVRSKIAQVRAAVKQTAAMMDYLAGQYQAALKNDETALLMVYLYGRYVKGDPGIVADLPARVPGSRLAELSAALAGAERGDMAQVFNAAEQLRAIASIAPDTVIKQRTLYAALKLYDGFMATPQTERDRIHRTLALMAREGVVADGARRAVTIDPFAVPEAAPVGATMMAPATRAESGETVIVDAAGAR
jgi:hypothetical protein